MRREDLLTARNSRKGTTMPVKNEQCESRANVVLTRQEDPFRLRRVTLGGDTPSLASEVAFELGKKAQTAGATEAERGKRRERA